MYFAYIFNTFFLYYYHQEFNELNAKGLDDVILKTDYYEENILHEIRKILDMPPLNINLSGKLFSMYIIV